MGILFGLFVVLILAIGLLSRRKQKETWVKEERYDESGAWLDKRASERGTFGSLDEEMEQTRQNQNRQINVGELTRMSRNYAFEHYPGFHTLSDAKVKTFSDFAKTKFTVWVATIEQLLNGQAPLSATQPSNDTPHSLALKKQILDFSYHRFPQLLDLEIEVIKKLDHFAGNISETLVEKIEALKA